jgi:hypothetical protein
MKLTRRSVVIGLGSAAFIASMGSFPFAIRVFERYEYFQMGALYATKYRAGTDGMIADIESEKNDDEKFMTFMFLPLPEDENKAPLRQKFDRLLTMNRRAQYEMVASFVQGFRSVAHP